VASYDAASFKKTCGVGGSVSVMGAALATLPFLMLRTVTGLRCHTPEKQSTCGVLI